MSLRQLRPLASRLTLRIAIFLVACAGVMRAAAEPIETSWPSGDISTGPLESAPLTKIADVFQIPRDAPGISFPVNIEGVVTYTVEGTSSFFIHDGQMGIHVSQPAGPRVRLGERVRVVGSTRRGRYAPSVIPHEVVSLGVGAFPAPRTVSFTQIASGSMDSQWLEVTGVVWSAKLSENRRFVILDLAMESGRVKVVVNAPIERPEVLVDSEVRLMGVATGVFNRHGQMVEPQIRTPGAKWVTVTEPAPVDVFSQPTRIVSRLLEFSPDSQLQHRVKVRGVVTRYFADNTFFLRDEQFGLKVNDPSPVKFRSGDLVEVAGFPVIANNEVSLQDAVCRKLAGGAPPVPVRSSLKELLDGSHASDLVVVQARLVDSVTDGPNVSLILDAGIHLFKGLLRQPPEWTAPEKGSLLDVTGICVINELEDSWFYRPNSFFLKLASPDDLRVLQTPRWWTAERLWRALILTLGMLAAGAGWLLALQRQVQKKRSVIEYQASHAAVLEERSRIARDLHDTLEQGLTGLSLQLKAIETELHGTPHPAASHLALFRHMLRQSRALARNAIRELRVESPTPRHENFISALDAAAEMWRHSGALEVKTQLIGEPRPLPVEIEHSLIGIGIEAMTNAVKHGRATQLQIDITFGVNLVSLRVTDNGCGFDQTVFPAVGQGCFGLQGMKERTDGVAGRLEICSRPGQGTVILAEIPVSKPGRSWIPKNIRTSAAGRTVIDSAHTLS